MLSELYPPERLGPLLIPRDLWRPFPTAEERAPWEGLPPSLRQAHLARGEQALTLPWPVLPATLFLDFARTGNRSRYEQESFARRRRLCDLVIAECLEGKGRFVDAIADGVWAICEESYWGVPAHLGMQRAGVGLPDVAEPTVDLFVGETVGLLAWTSYLVGDQLEVVSPLLGDRIYWEAERRVLTPCLERDDFWWMGFDGRPVNNWNPWCNSNWLTAALLLERDEERRRKAVAKILRSLDRFLEPYPADGGCDEGPGYWGRAGASLFDCLELLYSATAGRLAVYDYPLVQEIGRYLYRVQIADQYFVNFADAPALLSPSAPLVFRYGQRLGDSRMMALGAWLARQQDLLHRGLSDSLGRQLPGLFVLEELMAAEAAQPLPRDVWFPQLQVMAARDQEGSAKGWYVAAKGGHNAESHNHNDIGQFLVYIDGRPLIVDVGVETYTAKTFSRQRYEIWTMQSAYHNLPTLGGIMQAPGREFAARAVKYQADEAKARFQLDLASAYPSQARLRSWVRTVVLHRGQQVEVIDTYELEQAAEEIVLSLITPCQVVLGRSGELYFEERELAQGRVSGHGRLHYPADKLTPIVETIPLADPHLRQSWGTELFRLLLRAEKPPLQDTWSLRFSD